MEHANAVGYLDSEGRYSFEFLRPAHQPSKENELDITNYIVDLTKEAMKYAAKQYFLTCRGACALLPRRAGCLP